jgi:hypothetical protein
VSASGPAESRAPRGAAAEPASAETGEDLAIAIARHLIGEPPRSEEILRWRRAIDFHDARLARERDRRLWALITRKPWLIGPVDAGLALLDPVSPVRHRLYLMLAVLEASPDHTHHFLMRNDSALALLALAPRLTLAALRAALGVALVGAANARWR